MIISVGFIILMVVLAGALCYTGDILGRKLGKKRLTILGLRPKHTAAVMTAVFGAFSTAVIILIIAAASADVRTWILEGNRARVQLAETERKLSELEGSRKSLEDQNKTLTSERDKNASEIGKQKTELEKSTTEVKRLVAETKRLSHDAAKFRNEVAKARLEVARVQGEIKRSNEEYKAVKQNNNEIVRQNKEINQRNLQLDQENLKLEKDVIALQKQFDDLSTEREKLKTDLESAQQQFDAQIQSKTKELQEVSDDLLKASQELERVQTDLRDQQAKLLQISDQLSTTRADLRMKPLQVNRGDELARVPLRPRMNLEESRRALILALDLSSDEAKRRGAAQVPGENDYAVFMDLPTEEKLVKKEQQMADAINNMIDRANPRLLIMRSMFNTFQGEFVPVYVDIVDNPVIFEKEQLVDQFDVDGSKTEQEIANVIADRAATVTRSKALQAGIIPAIGRPQAIGELSRETVINLVQSIKTANRRVQVRLFAKEQTRAGDVLRLEYKIR